MATQVRPYYYVNDPDCASREMGPTDCLFVTALPTELPNDWSEFPADHSFSPGDQVWYVGRLFAANTTNTKGTTNPVQSNNWDHVGGHLTLRSGSASVDPVMDITSLELSLNIDRTLNGSSVGLTKSLSGGVGEYVLNLDPDDFVGEGATVSTANGIVGNGGSADPVSLDLYPQKVSLFLGTRGATGTTVDSIAGSTRAYLAFTTNGTNYFFIRGINIDTSDVLNQVFADGGAGVWTTGIPTTAGSITVANSANLIG